MNLLADCNIGCFERHTDISSLVHQQRTADQTSSAASGVLPGVAALLLWLFLRRVAAAVATLLAVTLLLAIAATVSALLLAVASLIVSALLAVGSLALVARPGVLICAFAVLLVHEDPAILAVVPLGVPWRRDWRGTMLLLTAVLLLTTVLLLPTILLLAAVLLLTAMLAFACKFVNNAIEEAHCAVC
jgi:hypothetical protein